MLQLLTWFSALSFLFYGMSCLISKRMEVEFARYGLSNYRKITGALQIAGTLGLLIGLAQPLVGLLASAGLAVQMLLGVGVRLRIKDSFLQTTPALLYCGINTYLCRHFLLTIN